MNKFIKQFLALPSKNLVLTVPLTLLAGFVAGLIWHTEFLKSYILPFTFFMIYPTMIGFKLQEAINMSYMKIVLVTSLLNFVVIPFIAIIFGKIFLADSPLLIVGIVMMSLFPTSGMTISWTMLSKGNVPAAIKVTALSLILGSFLAPVYLSVLVGALVNIDVMQTMITVLQIVILPMLLGHITFKFYMSNHTQQQFATELKPLLPGISTWGMVFIIFSSISMKAKVLLTNPGILLVISGILLLFYALNFAISTMVGRLMFDRADGYAIVYGTVMRNLSIALGIAVTSFGSDTALFITMAFIIQVQLAAWYGRISNKYNWLGRFLNKIAVLYE